jgi:PAS domain S-box-containing protein
MRRREVQFNDVQRLAHVGSWDWEPKQDAVVWSDELYRIFGLEPQDRRTTYERVLERLHPEDRKLVEDLVARSRQDREPFSCEHRIIRPDGTVRVLQSQGAVVLDEAGRVVRMFGTSQDITEQKRREEELRKAREELEGRVAERTADLTDMNTVLQEEVRERSRMEADRVLLLRRLVTAQEDERRRIAREMHDQFGQQLTALTLELSALKRAPVEGDLNQHFESLEAIASQLNADVDFLVWELRPTVLDDLGLLAALENYVRRWSKHSGIEAELHVWGMERDRLTNEIEITLYRITQEALTNIARHAGAGNVDLLLERRTDQVSLIVEDDGRGFDVEQTLRSERGGFGLIGMRERVALVGGSLHVESKPGQGTTVVVRIPAPHVAGGQERNG